SWIARAVLVAAGCLLSGCSTGPLPPTPDVEATVQARGRTAVAVAPPPNAAATMRAGGAAKLTAHAGSRGAGPRASRGVFAVYRESIDLAGNLGEMLRDPLATPAEQRGRFYESYNSVSERLRLIPVPVTPVGAQVRRDIDDAGAALGTLMEGAFEA